jgi:RNA polymerase primary sigma factor
MSKKNAKVTAAFAGDPEIKNYFNKLGSSPNLTREEEAVLIKDLEFYQKQIIDSIIIDTYAQAEVFKYLRSLDTSGEEIINISKHLDPESSETDIKNMTAKFKALLRSFETKDKDSLLMNINAVSLAGNIVHGILVEIKKKHLAIQELDSRFKSIKKYFEGFKSDDFEILSLIKSQDESLKQFLTKEYRLSQVQVSNKLSEWQQYVSDCDVLLADLFGASFVDVKEIYRKIAQFEVGASNSRTVLISRNLKLVIFRAKNFLNKGLDFDDLIQEGNAGLIKAIDKFDSSKKTKISTYATWWIDQGIRRAISNKGKTVRVPTHIEWQQTKLNQVISKLTAKLVRPPTLKEIAAESGIDIKTLEDLQTRAQHEIGMDEELSSGMTLGEMLTADPSESPFVITEQKLLRERIRKALATLKPFDEKVIRLRYGIGEVPDDEGVTLQEIADKVSLTKQGVRVVECRALKNLRKKIAGLSHE